MEVYGKNLCRFKFYARPRVPYLEQNIKQPSN